MFVDCARSQRELGFKAGPVAAALERAVRWYEANGYVSQRRASESLARRRNVSASTTKVHLEPASRCSSRHLAVDAEFAPWRESPLPQGNLRKNIGRVAPMFEAQVGDCSSGRHYRNGYGESRRFDFKSALASQRRSRRRHFIRTLRGRSGAISRRPDRSCRDASQLSNSQDPPRPPNLADLAAPAQPSSKVCSRPIASSTHRKKRRAWPSLPTRSTWNPSISSTNFPLEALPSPSSVPSVTPPTKTYPRLLESRHHTGN